MKKPKINLGAGALKGLLVQHVEKLAFGFAVLLVFMFIVLGYRLDSDLDGKTPDSLKTLALNAVSNIERATHQKVESDRTPRNGQGGQYFTRLKEVSRPPNPEVYSADKPWSPPLGKPGAKRVDPEIYPPIRLETAALTGALCVRSDDTTAYLLDELPNAPMPEERPRRTRPTRGQEDATDLSGVPGTREKGVVGGGRGPSADETPGGKGTGKTRGTRGKGGMPEDPLPLFGKEGDSTRDRGDKKRKEDTAIGPMRVYPAHLVCGYRPGDTGTTGFMPGSMIERKGFDAGGNKGLTPGVDGGSGTRAGWGTESGKPIVQSVSVIAVKALAPYRKQADEFKRALGEAIGFDPVRDRPKLVFFQAQRADVTDDLGKELADSDWKMIAHPKQAQKMAADQRWHGVMPEVADLDYVDPSVTMPGPPLMLRCLDDFLLHSEVPRGTSMSINAWTQDEKKPDEGRPSGEPKAESDMPGGVGGDGFPGQGFPGAGPANGQGGGDSFEPGMTGKVAPPWMSGKGGMPGPWGKGGMPGMPGMPAMSGYGQSTSAGTVPVQYKLVRFFDMDVQPGRVYRYRIRLFVEDPNNPNTDRYQGAGSNPPPRRTLAPEVIARLNRQQSDDQLKNAFYVITDWSEPTEPVSLPSASRVFVGEVDRPRMASGTQGTLVQQSEMRGNVVPVGWHEKYSVDVAAETRAYRGSVLNFKQQFEVLDPVSLVVKLLKDFPLQSNYLVVDIRGGEDLPGDRKHVVTAAGEYFLLDDRGDFVVRNELDDYEDYRRFTLEDAQSPGGTGLPGLGGFGTAKSIPGAEMAPGTVKGTESIDQWIKQKAGKGEEARGEDGAQSGRGRGTRRGR